MRVILQKVSKASVRLSLQDQHSTSTEAHVNHTIAQGLCLLVGIAQDDTREDLLMMYRLVRVTPRARKILDLRLFSVDSKRFWTHSVKDLELEILSVSQFTLYAIASQGTSSRKRDG